MTLFFLLWYWFCTRFANWMGQFCGFISHIRTSHGTFSHQGLVITRDIQPRRSINFFLTNFNSLVMEWWLLIWLLIHFFFATTRYICHLLPHNNFEHTWFKLHPHDPSFIHMEHSSSPSHEPIKGSSFMLDEWEIHSYTILSSLQ